MRIQALPAELSVLFLASRPQYLGASVAPVLVGSALGYAMVGSFNLGLFVLAVLAIMALHAGANVTNDYFDSQSRNDWVNKRTMIVAFGIPPWIVVYRATLAATYVAAGTMLLREATFFGGLFYLLTLPLGIFAMRAANAEDLTTPGLFRANQLTILLHNVGSIALAAGLLLPGLVS